ncbi:C40 family peptidase [Phycicoccus duodecadis]|uniref:Cell wall-associated NlpC family hydrolase n=1 Tax=Phycicoccus duodecadis TaxID=173053 RepID=A0A2N3YKZ7_9MICO|nr:C40 family peptidase [Phycicoccus duodecadis]PKW27526.1 cell wall-associated NlpC family hydrolase [Phycicoccus duodecadis]
MSEPTRSGRHRSAVQYSPVAELSSIVRTAGETGARATAVLAASGGLVATFALPAHASVGFETSARAGAPAAGSTTLSSSPRALAAAPAVVAPQPAAPLPTEVVGISGVRAVAKPKPKPRPKPVVAVAVADRAQSQTASRSTTRRVLSSMPQSSSAIVNIARGLLGIPYVYGGSSPSGFDCSGFTSYVFRQAGISIPRTASAQQSAATPVSNPQPGDLVFFGSPAWHVGIYTGNGMMIDAGKPGEVTQERAIFSGVSGYGRF